MASRLLGSPLFGVGGGAPCEAQHRSRNTAWLSSETTKLESVVRGTSNLKLLRHLWCSKGFPSESCIPDPLIERSGFVSCKCSGTLAYLQICNPPNPEVIPRPPGHPQLSPLSPFAPLSFSILLARDRWRPKFVRKTCLDKKSLGLYLHRSTNAFQPTPPFIAPRGFMLRIKPTRVTQLDLVLVTRASRS